MGIAQFLENGTVDMMGLLVIFGTLLTCCSVCGLCLRCCFKKRKERSLSLNQISNLEEAIDKAAKSSLVHKASLSLAASMASERALKKKQKNKKKRDRKQSQIAMEANAAKRERKKETKTG